MHVIIVRVFLGAGRHREDKLTVPRRREARRSCRLTDIAGTGKQQRQAETLSPRQERSSPTVGQRDHFKSSVTHCSHYGWISSAEEVLLATALHGKMLSWRSRVEAPSPSFPSEAADKRPKLTGTYANIKHIYSLLSCYSGVTCKKKKCDELIRFIKYTRLP